MTVFANNVEVSAKAQGCKIIAAFPDTCFTPPQTPATPPGVPIPYPNFAMDSDLTGGSSKVLIGGKEVSMENASKWSKVSGDEAGSAPKKGIITSKNTGAAYAKKWSMDVKVESKGVVRFTDMATTNHASETGDGPPWIVAGIPGSPTTADEADCLVGSYDKMKTKCNNRGGEAHHIIPDEYVRQGVRGTPPRVTNPTDGSSVFPSEGEACCICVGGSGSGRKSKDSNKTAVKKKGKEYREKMNEDGGTFLGYDNAQGHGFAHFVFDGLFGRADKPIGFAVQLAYFALAELADFDGSTVDRDCAQIAAACIADQYKDALEQDPQPDCGRQRHRNSPSLDNRMEQAGVDQAAVTSTWTSWASNAGVA